VVSRITVSGRHFSGFFNSGWVGAGSVTWRPDEVKRGKPALVGACLSFRRRPVNGLVLTADASPWGVGCGRFGPAAN